MDKENVVHMYNEILLSHKKKEFYYFQQQIKLGIIMLNKLSQAQMTHTYVEFEKQVTL